MDVKRIAVVGLGSIGRRHVKVLKAWKPNVDIIAVRSGKGNTCEEEQLCTKVVYSLKQALREGVQAAIIASPAPFHLKQASAFAKQGVHLLIEKPLAHTWKSVENFVSLYNDTGLCIQTGYVLRFRDDVAYFRQLLEHTSLGKITNVRIVCGSFLPGWRPDADYRKTVSASKKMGGGVLLEISHEFDYMHWFFGKPVFVHAILQQGNNLRIDVEEQADILAQYQTFPVSMHLDFLARFSERNCTVYCERGKLVLDMIEKTVIIHEAGKDPVTRCFVFDYDAPYRAQLGCFFDCIETGKKPQPALTDAVAVMGFIRSAIRSDVTGRRQLL